MGRGFARFEFAPTDIGGSVVDANGVKRVEAAMEQLGWQPLQPSFDAQDEALLIPRKFCVVCKGNTIFYLSKSGYGVARYTFPYDEPSAETVASAMRDRVDFQCTVRDGISDPTTDVAKLVHELRKIQKTSRRDLYRCLEDEPVHEYSFSVYSFPTGLEEKLAHAVLYPREVGCSLSLSQANLPPADELASQIERVQVALPEPVRDSLGNRFWSNWSAAVIESGSSDLEAIVTLCEFRIQSTWLTAYKTAEFASQADLVGSNSKGLSRMRFLQSDFAMIVARHRARLGANSPELESKLVDELNKTSDLESEIARAEASIETAVATMAYYDERSNTNGRRFIEIAAWIFGASGLAELLFETPIRWSTVTTQPGPFGVWVLLATVGGIVVFRQH